MKHISILIVFLFCFATFDISAQKKEKKKRFKPSKVCINEVFLHNDSDPFSYKREWHILEWIEIFNGTSETICLNDYFLTDNLDTLSKWSIRPISQRYVFLKKKKFFPVYVGERARRNGAHLDDFKTKSGFLYLTTITQGKYVIVDTIKLPENKQYPYSRYPDGSEFTRTDILTPGIGNMLSSESESKNSYGANFQLGMATIISKEYQNSSHPAPAGGFGVYSRKNLGSFAMEYGMRLGIRGYRIDFSTIRSTNTGIDDVRSKGRQTLYYIDLPFYLSKGLFKNLDFFAGPMFSIKIKSSQVFTTERIFTPSDPSKPVIYSSTKYRFNEGNPALDLVDLSLVLGLRYRLNSQYNLSLYYINDITGLNLGSSNVLGSQQTKGVFLSIGKALYSGKKRVKLRHIFN